MIFLFSFLDETLEERHALIDSLNEEIQALPLASQRRQELYESQLKLKHDIYAVN